MMTSRCLDIDSVPREPIKLLKSPSVTRHVPDATRARSIDGALRDARANESERERRGRVASRRLFVMSAVMRANAVLGDHLGDCWRGRRRRRRFDTLRPSTRRRASARAMANGGFGRPGESWDDAFSSPSSSSGKFWSQTPWQLVEALAKTFLCRSPSSTSGRGVGGASGTRDISTRAWLVDESVDEVADRTTIRATEKEVRLARDADGLKNFELYALLRSHERAVVVAKLRRPTILVDDANLVVVDAIDLDVSENSLNDRCLANYWYSCPLRSSDDEAVGVGGNGMCGFECAIRSKIASTESVAASHQPTYWAALFSTNSGDLEEFLITSTGDSSSTRRATFSTRLRALLD